MLYSFRYIQSSIFLWIFAFNWCKYQWKDEDRSTAHHIAAIHNCKEEINYNISHDANINEKDENGNTALQKAVAENNKEIVELLILHDANINEKEYLEELLFI